ncbi:MAG: hypothetical protein KDK99_17800 [Verrucomicrobiales bacterium]|nr:hypothetical protein [Verrucomicrobiales bacterium]
MMQRWSQWIVAAAALALLGCKEADSAPKGVARGGGVRESELVKGADGLARLEEGGEPYTGAVISWDKSGQLRHFAFYEEGQMHGPEMRFHEDGRVRRIFDFERGSRVRQREWFANGVKKVDAMQRDGVGFGPMQTWYEDGSERWKGTFGEGLAWEGHVVDHDPTGKILWDGEFKNGQYLSGIYPEDAQEELIRRGRVKPEEALYPLKEAKAGEAVEKPKAP